jgi:hypothetical protein
VHLELASGCSRVDPFTERHERNPKRVEFLEQHDQLSVAPESIEAPHCHAIDYSRRAPAF